LEVARREKPDVILLDLAIGKENGLDYIPDLLALSNQPRILVLTGVPDPVMHHRAVQLGALGLVLKSKAPGVLTEAIKKIHEGEAWLDRTMIANVITEMSRSNKEEKNHSEAARIDSLTKREHDIISLVAKGFKNKQIADQLCISHITVRHHLTSIFSKLEVSDRFELIIYVFNNGLYDWPQHP
jgi:DNA-binding NarL/FixJ family response regulator